MQKSFIIIYMVCLFTGTISFANAGWEVAGPNGSFTVQKFAKIGNTVFVHCNGLYRSDDYGRNWLLIDNCNRYEVYDMITNDSCIFLKVENDKTDENWIRSKNKGDTWEQCNTNPDDKLSATGDMLFRTGIANKAVFSYDYGDTWNTSDSSIRGIVNDYAFLNQDLFACTDSGLFVSKDKGRNWTLHSSNPGSKVHTYGEKLFLNTGGPNFMLFDGKTNEWKSFNYQFSNYYPNPISGDNNTCYLASSYGIKKMSDAAITDINFISCLYSDPVIMLCDSTLLLGTDGYGIFRSDNDGQTWEPSNNGIFEEKITSMVCNKGTLYSSTHNKVLKSADNGDTWSMIGKGLPLRGGINTIAIVKDTLFAGINSYNNTNNNSFDTSRSRCQSPYGLLKYEIATDQWVRGFDSLTWVTAFDSLTMADNISPVNTILSYNNVMLYPFSSGIKKFDLIKNEWSLYKLKATQKQRSKAMDKHPGNSGFGEQAIETCFLKDSLLFVGSSYEETIGGGIFIFNVNTSNYTQVYESGIISYFTSIGDVIFAAGKIDYHPFFLKSIDKGKTWIELPIPFKGPDELVLIDCLGSYKNIVLASLDNKGFCFSADTGKTWSKIPTSRMFRNIESFTCNDNYLFAAGQGIWRLPLTELENTHTQFRVRNDSHLNKYQVKNSKLYLGLDLQSTENVSIMMYNLQGKLINKITYNQLTQGKHDIVLNNNNQTSFCSIIKIKVGSDIQCLPVHFFR